MADEVMFGTPETWGMKVGQFIEEKENILPQPKPQDIIEQRRKDSLRKFLFDYPGAVEQETVDYIQRENFARAGEVGKPLISDSELRRLAKKFTQKEIAEKTGLGQATIQRYFTRLGIKSAFQPGGYKGAISEARKELEKKLPKIRKLYLTDKLTIPEIADELGYTKKQVESVIEAMRGQGGDYKYRGNIIEPERKKLYEKNKITKEDFAKRGKLNPLKTPQSVVDNVIKDSKNFSFSETAKRNNVSTTTVNKIRKKYNLKFPYTAGSLRKVSDRVTKDANKLLNILNKNPELVTNIEKLYEKAGFNKNQGNSAIQALKAKTILSGNVPRFDLSKSEQKLVDKLAAPRISAETVAREAGIKDADVRSGMLRPRVALQEYFAVGDPKKRGTVFEHSFPRSLIPFVKGKKLQQELMVTGERTSPFLNDFKIRFDRLQKNAVEKFLKDGNLTEYNKTINNIRDTVRKATGGYEIGYIKFDKNKNATPIVKAKPITEGVKQFGIETTQKVSGFKNSKYTTNLLKKYVKNPDDPIFNTLKDEVPVEKITPEVIEASEDAAKAYKKAEPFIGNRQKFINFAKNNLDNSLVNALFKSPYGRGALITGAVLSPSFLAADEIEEMPEEEDSILPEAAVGAAAVAPLATKKGRSIYGKAGKGLLKMLSTPSAAAGFGAYELSEGNPKLAGASLLAPEILSKVAPKGQGILSMAGRIAANPFGKFARAFTPVGLATIGAGALYDVYKEYERRQALTDEERLEEDIERDRAYDETMIGAAEGGIIRLGLADGPKKKGLKNPGRREFMKTTGKLAGIAALLPYGIGKGVKIATKAAPAVSEGVKLGIDKLMLLVDKIKLLGKDVTPNYATKEREQITLYQGKDGASYELAEDLSTGDIRVTRDVEGGATYGDKSYDTIEDRTEFQIRKGEVYIKDEGLETQKAIQAPDEYDEGRAVFDQDGTVADVDEVDDAVIEAIEDEIK